MGRNRIEQIDDEIRYGQYKIIDPSNRLTDQRLKSERFAGGAEDQFRRQGQNLQSELAAQYGDLSAIAAGQRPTIAGERLRQQLGANLLAQRAQMAAGGGAPQAMYRAAGAGSNLGMQQSIADIQERARARQLLGQNLASLGDLRGQEQQAALQGRQNALRGYGALEDARAARHKYGQARIAQDEANDERKKDRLTGGFLSAVGGALFSDRRVKKDVRKGDKDAGDFLKTLRPYSYRYKKGYGEGEQFGIMAQDLEKSRAGRAAVIDTPAGKMVHGAKLAAALAAAASTLDKRVSKLERGK